MMRLLAAIVLCCVTGAAFAQTAMRPDQFVARPWAWTGTHENVPRQTLTPSGTVFTPPASFGNFWVTTSAGGQTIACPSSIADGEQAAFHLQQGASAPFSPNISFTTPCYGWSGGIQPTWPTAANSVSDVFCWSMSPADVTGASFVCAPQLNVSSNPPKTFVRSGVAAATATSVALTMNASAQNSAICATFATAGTVTSVTDSNTDTFTAGDSVVAGGHEMKLWRFMTLPNNVTSFTANIASSTNLKIGCYIFNGVTTYVASAGFNTQAPAGGTGANTVTSTSLTVTAGHLLVGINYESVATSSISPGTSPIAFTGATADGTGAAYIISGEYAIAPGGSVVTTFGNTANNNFYTDAIDLN